MSRLTLSLLAALGAAVLLAACGGGGSSTSAGGTAATASTASTAETTAEAPEKSPSKQGEAPKTIVEPREEEHSDESPAQAKKAIEAAIVQSVTGEDPASCTKLESPAFVEQTTGESGTKAIRVCEQEAEEGGSETEDVSVKSVESVGESAVALVEVSGGTLDGQTLEVAVRREDGSWRLGKLIGFQDFDRGAYIGALGEAMSEAGGAEAKARGCVTGGLEKVTTQELENVVLVGAAPAIVAAFEACQ